MFQWTSGEAWLLANKQLRRVFYDVPAQPKPRQPSKIAYDVAVDVTSYRVVDL